MIALVEPPPWTIAQWCHAWSVVPLSCAVSLRVDLLEVQLLVARREEHAVAAGALVDHVARAGAGALGPELERERAIAEVDLCGIRDGDVAGARADRDRPCRCRSSARPPGRGRSCRCTCPGWCPAGPRRRSRSSPPGASRPTGRRRARWRCTTGRRRPRRPARHRLQVLAAQRAALGRRIAARVDGRRAAGAAAQLAVVGAVEARPVAAAHVERAVGPEGDRADRVARELLAPVVDQHLLGPGARRRRSTWIRDSRALTTQPSVVGPGGEGQASFHAGAVPPIGASYVYRT